MSEYIPLRRNNGQYGGKVLNASHQNIAKIEECKMKYLVTVKQCFPPMKMKKNLAACRDGRRATELGLLILADQLKACI